MITEITLPDDRFFDKNLTGLRRKNFFFGKNGTGKSTITRNIREQYKDEYDVRIFQGYENIVKENGGLTAIVLGKENTDIQPKIDNQESQINHIQKKLEENNLKLEESIKKCDSLHKKIDSFCKKSAKEIKSLGNDYWEKDRYYNKQDFKDDINNSCELSEEEIKTCKKTLTENKKLNYEKNVIYEPDVSNYLQIVNSLIITSISNNVALKFKSNEEENWAREGIKLHSKDDHCAFCNNKITEERWESLNDYFNATVKDLESELSEIDEKINNEIEKIEDISLINESSFYFKFKLQVIDINSKINECKKENISFLKHLLTSVNERKDNIFSVLNPIELIVPSGFDSINTQYNDLVKKNEEYTAELENTQQDARKKLRLNEVKKKLKDFDYFKKETELENYENVKEICQSNYDEKKKELRKANAELNKLLSQTKDESIAVSKINEQLKTLGNQSFALKKMDDNNNINHKGQYEIEEIGENGKEKKREIDSLSTGEKNIVAFLWFMYDLEDPEKKTSKDMIVVFDDPMSSNDDTVQYLITSKLQILLREADKNSQQIFIFTHNEHFYLNVRYRWWDGYKGKGYDKMTVHLKKCEKKTRVVHITEKEEDIKTSYDELWDEVHWLYDQDKPDFMLNPLRRIIETYQKFNKIDKIYLTDPESQKLLNVNSHEIDPLEIALNGKDRSAIMDKVEEIFKNVNAADHFNRYWKKVK